MVIQFTAFKNRYCHGTRTDTARSTENEPPLDPKHPVMNLGTVDIPPEDYRGSVVPSGQDVTFDVRIEHLPEIMPKSFIYRAVWQWKCDRLEMSRPIREMSPQIAVQQ